LLLGVVAPALAISVAPAAGGELEEKLAAICKLQDVPGIIAASIGPDGVIESACTGVRKRGTKDAIAKDDQFAIGSNTKSFTATLAAVFVDDGAMEWSTTISDVWPDQPVHDGFKKVTLEQLLAHTGGFQTDLPTTGKEWASFFAEKYKPEQERARMCHMLLTKAPEGTIGKFAYSNLGYVIAAAMLEAWQKPLEQLMKIASSSPRHDENEFFSTKN
jgi:CubicO group peptidase (beta-lactamase class C family)